MSARPAIGAAGELKISAEVHGQIFHKEKPEPHAFTGLFGGEKGIAGAFKDISRRCVSLICYGDTDGGIGELGVEFDLASCRICLVGIIEQNGNGLRNGVARKDEFFADLRMFKNTHAFHQRLGQGLM